MRTLLNARSLIVAALAVLFFFVLPALVPASAQGLDALPDLTPATLGADVFALGAAVLFVVQFAKRQVERHKALPPAAWIALSFTLGVAGAFALHALGHGAVYAFAYPLGTVAYGVLAGAIASGFKDLVSGFLKGAPGGATLGKS